MSSLPKIYVAEFAYSPHIRIVQPSRVTDKMYWVNGQRSHLHGAHHQSFQSFDEAKAKLIEQCKARVTKAEESVEYQKKLLSDVEAVTEVEGVNHYWMR